MQSDIPIDVDHTELAAALLQAVDHRRASPRLCAFLYVRHRKAYFAWFASAWALYLLRSARSSASC